MRLKKTKEHHVHYFFLNVLKIYFLHQNKWMITNKCLDIWLKTKQCHFSSDMWVNLNNKKYNYCWFFFYIASCMRNIVLWEQQRNCWFLVFPVSPWENINGILAKTEIIGCYFCIFIIRLRVYYIPSDGDHSSSLMVFVKKMPAKFRCESHLNTLYDVVCSDIYGFKNGI